MAEQKERRIEQEPQQILNEVVERYRGGVGPSLSADGLHCVYRGVGCAASPYIPRVEMPRVEGDSIETALKKLAIYASEEQIDVLVVSQYAHDHACRGRLIVEFNRGRWGIGVSETAANTDRPFTELILANLKFGADYLGLKWPEESEV